MKYNVIALMAALYIHDVNGDGYGSGISKNTYSSTDPINDFNFLHEVMTLYPLESFTLYRY